MTVRAELCQTWLVTPNTSFLLTQLISHQCYNNGITCSKHAELAKIRHRNSHLSSNHQKIIALTGSEVEMFFLYLIQFFLFYHISNAKLQNLEHKVFNHLHLVHPVRCSLFILMLLLKCLKHRYPAPTYVPPTQALGHDIILIDEKSCHPTSHWDRATNTSGNEPSFNLWRI